LSERNFEVVEGNDPLRTFTLRYQNEDKTYSPATVAGADEVELYVKDLVTTADGSALVKLTKNAAGATQRITVQGAPNDNKVDVQFLASDFQWADAITARVYHLDVIKSDKRTTFAHGKISKVNV
jgi:hypothetical protein